MSATTFPTRGSEAARVYLDRGWQPIRLDGPRSKKVTRAGWRDERVAADADLSGFDGTNLGLRLGLADAGRLADADLDCREAVVAAAYLLPATGLVSGRPSNPRSHHWYVCPVPPDRTEKFKDEAGNVLVELRSGGEMTVVPPSINPGDGDNGHTPEPVVWHADGEPAVVPAADLRRAVAAVAAAALLARHWPKKGRHDAALLVAGALLRAPGWDADRVKKLLTAVCAAAGDGELTNRMACVDATADSLAAGGKTTGWPKFEKQFGAAVTGKVRDWLCPPPTITNGKGKPGATGNAAPPEPAAWVPPAPFGRDAAPPEFPVDVLPAWLGEYVGALSHATQTPLAAGGLLALAATAGGLAAAVRYRVRPGWKKNANLFAVVAMSSAERKTAVFNAVFAPVLAAERRAVELAGPVVAAAAAEKAVLESRLKKKQADAAKADDPAERQTFTDEAKELAQEIAAFDVPPLPVFLVDDDTVQMLEKTLVEQGGRLLQAAPEGTAFENAGGRYTDTENFDVYLKAHDGDPLRSGRVGRGRIGHDDPRLTCALAVQPDVLTGLGRSRRMAARGFLARWLYAVPAQMAGTRAIRPAPVPAAEEAKYRRVMELIWSLPVATEGTTEVPFARAADDALAAFEARVEPQLADGGALLAGPASWGGKLCGEVARIAGTLHLAAAADRPGGIGAAGPVPAEAVAAAVRLADAFLIPHARLAFAAMHLDEVEALARRVLGWLARHPEVARFYRRDVYQDLKGGGSDLKSDDLIPAFARLEEHHYLRPEGAPGGPGRPPEVWLANPRWERNPANPPPNPPKPDAADPDTHVSGDSGEGPGGPQRDSDRVSGDSGEGLPRVAPDDTQDDAGGNGHDADYPPPNPPKPDGAGDAHSPDADPVSPSGEVGDFNFGANVRGDSDPATVPTTPTTTDDFVGYTLVTDPAGLGAVEAAIRAEEVVGLDTETTGLDPRTDRLRLLSLHTPAGTFLLDCFAVDPAPLFDALAGAEVVGHNLLFDLGFLHRLGFAPGRAFDTMLASQVLDAGDKAVRHTLKDVVGRHLGAELDKGEQKSDWSGALTPDQLRYAAADAAVPVRLRAVMLPKIAADGLAATLALEHRALPAVGWMGGSGVGLDRAGWETQAGNAEAERDRLAAELDALSPAGHDLTGPVGRNWNSPDQVKQALASVGVTVEAADDDALAGVAHPLAALVRGHRSAAKRAGTYGRAWLEHVAQDDRVYPGWRQLGAGASGRMSCANPNLQQLPRDVRYRRLFVAPEGRVLVKADYSQIELRLAAKIANEPAMRAAYERGEDLHTNTARAILGVQAVTKADRQLAKAVNFGLLYGMGAKAFARYAHSNYGVKLIESQAAAYRRRFFQAYPGLAAWHRRAGDAPRDTRTVGGRLRRKVVRFTERLNTPVQGTGADGLKAALALLWERRADCPGAVPVLAVHDEIVVEADATKADAAKAWLIAAMTDGMAPLAAPVPVDVEVTVARTWGSEL